MPTEDQSRRRRQLFVWTLIAFFIIFLIGIIGFSTIANLDLIDSFHNTTFYISGMGAIAPMNTSGQKVFSSVYAFVSGFLFLSVAVFVIDQFVIAEFLGEEDD